MLKEFREFILRGSLVDLAVAVVIGTAFGAVVTAFVRDLVTPIIAAVGGEPDFAALTFTINGSRFFYGDFLNVLLAFVIIAAVIVVLVITPVNALMARLQPSPPVDVTTRACPQCLSDIPLAATRCAFCTATVVAASGPPAPEPA